MNSSSILVGVGFIVAGALIMMLGGLKNRRCSCRTVGKITGAREYKETDDDGFHHYSYSPEFEYEVNGQQYHGVGGTTYKKQRKIQIGGDIVVFYNPNEPKENLTKGGRLRQQLAGALAIAFGVVWIAAVLFL